MLARALLYPAVKRVEYASKRPSNLVSAPFSQVLKEAIRDLTRSFALIFARSISITLHELRLPLLLLFGLSVPVLLFVLVKKLFTFIITTSELGFSATLQTAFNYPDRHLIIVVFLILYCAESVVWNSSLDNELRESLDGPQAGSVEGALLARIRKENGMKRGLKLPAEKDIALIRESIEAKARGAGLSLREYHRRKWLAQNGVIEEDTSARL